jgi:hypothetical protein
MPDFCIQDIAGFPGRFAVSTTVPLVLTTEQREFVARVEEMMGRYDDIGDSFVAPS